MRHLLQETEKNAKVFASEFIGELAAAHASLTRNEQALLSSYRSVVSLQGWRVLLLDRVYGSAANAFFLEAHNDALQSFVCANLGLWRPALQSLRSSIEGVFGAEYYNDHPVEYKLWSEGKHRFNYSDYASYFKAHPTGISADEDIDPLVHLRTEYRLLSQAVHASSIPYRMTIEGQLTISNVEPCNHGKWLARHIRTVRALNLFLMALYRDRLQGAELRELRKCISLAIPASLHARIHQEWGIHLFS